MKITNIQHGIVNNEGLERNQNLSAALINFHRKLSFNGFYVTLYLNEVIKRGDSRGEFRAGRKI